MSRRGWAITCCGVVVLAAVGVGTVVVISQGTKADASVNKPAPASTTTITKQNLQQQDTVDGTLGYSGSYQVAAGSAGVFTWLPSPGQTIGLGQQVYGVNGKPVPLLHGDTPFWRPLKSGMDNGTDVKVLEQNLKDLGYFFGTPGQKFTDATTAAIKRWQKALGVEQTGVVDPGAAVVLPTDIRVTTVDGVLGTPAQGKAISATGTSRLVTVKMPVSKQTEAVVGAKVDVALPGGKSGSGKITSVGTVASKPDQQNGQQGGGSPTIDVQVTLDDPATAGNLDGAPVQVSFTSEHKENVLTVPVNALLALAEGGYAVEVVDSAGSHLVKVDLGLFAAGRVEVTGQGLSEGTKIKAAGE